jgi:hypothetical protein
MSPAVIALIVVSIFALDTLIAAVVGKAVVAALWNPLANKYHAVDPAADAVRKNFQSFRFGAVNMGFCVHVAVDEHHLTLTAIRPLRWLGAKPISIPWDQITMKKRGSKWSTVHINAKSLHGPAWCLNLADPGDGTKVEP